MKNTVKAIVKQPNKPAEIRLIKNTLKAFQEIVGGYIEVVQLGDDWGNESDMIMVCNEEGLIDDVSEPNDSIAECYYGTVVFCQVDEAGEFCDLSQEQIVDLIYRDNFERSALHAQ